MHQNNFMMIFSQRKIPSSARFGGKNNFLTVRTPGITANVCFMHEHLTGLAGKWPDRFRCLVNVCGLLDLRAVYYSTEELWFPEWDLKGTPWENPQGYERHNPANYVSNWRTPMLVIHGGRDFRVVDTQGISTFTALQRRGIESKLLYFPDEGHGISKPHNRIQYYETVIAWFDRWLKN